jgi:hypothetical protein
MIIPLRRCRHRSYGRRVAIMVMVRRVRSEAPVRHVMGVASPGFRVSA